MTAPNLSTGRQTTIGLTLAALILGGWLSLHVWGVFFQPLTAPAIFAAPLLIGLQSWLGAGMFIVAHDAMHGSLAPGRPRLNAVIGQACVGAYAAFSYRRLNQSHHQHHRAPGTAADPDFHADRPDTFLPWFLAFFTRYFGWQEFAIVTAVLIAYLLIGASVANLILFWALPAILSALQLFVFGTWLPHRHDASGPAFADQHHARTVPMPWIASLLTCFHFGLHHEHHLSPNTPWWRLPEFKRDFEDLRTKLLIGESSPIEGEFDAAYFDSLRRRVFEARPESRAPLAAAAPSPDQEPASR